MANRHGHLIELRGIGMLTGEVGSGKTTVCRHLADQLHPGLYRVHYVSVSIKTYATNFRCKPPAWAAFTD